MHQLVCKGSRGRSVRVNLKEFFLDCIFTFTFTAQSRGVLEVIDLEVTSSSSRFPEMTRYAAGEAIEVFHRMDLDEGFFPERELCRRSLPPAPLRAHGRLDDC